MWTLNIEKGPASVESQYDENLATLEIVKESEGDGGGVDACVVNCFADPGIRASREVVKMLITPLNSRKC